MKKGKEKKMEAGIMIRTNEKVEKTREFGTREVNLIAEK